MEEEALKSIPKNPNKPIVQESSTEIIAGGKVFYNPVQEFNRDLSICVINKYFQLVLEERRIKQQKHNKTLEGDQSEREIYVAGKKYNDGLRILEALSATGLRSIRYAKEIAGVKQIIANDLSREAIQSIEENVLHNSVESLVEPSHANAMTLMYTSTAPEQRFDVIDLDPYGCPNRFLDGAVQSIVDGGLLLVTATDMAVLAGNAPESCFVKYGCVPVRMKCCHELALRILLNCIEMHANRYGKYITPLLSISVDFYVRIFVRVHVGQEKCKYSMSKQAMVFQCTGCQSFHLQALGNVKPNPTDNNPKQVKFGIPTGPVVGTHCEFCKQKHHLGGPIWSAPIHDAKFVADLKTAVNCMPAGTFATQQRIVGVLSMVSEELPDVPLYYTPDKLCNTLKLEHVPMMKFRSALLYAGYRVSYSHANKNSLKTDAPVAVLWDILRDWNKRHPVKAKRMIDGTPIKEILSQSCLHEYNFDDLHIAANPDSRKQALKRFPENPAPHWGPGTRATIMVTSGEEQKSHRNQNKRQKKMRESRNVNADDDVDVEADADASRNLRFFAN